MSHILKQFLILACPFLAIAFVPPVFSDNIAGESTATVEYSRDPATIIIAFREIYPEFAEQDPTPLIRIYGDGRVVVFHPAYMKKAGQYEMILSQPELEELLLQLAPALTGFDSTEVKKQKKAANELYRASIAEGEVLTEFLDSDAEFSVFHLNIHSYQAANGAGRTNFSSPLNKSWVGLQLDARDYPGLDQIQALMQAEHTLRNLSRREELVKVESAP